MSNSRINHTPKVSVIIPTYNRSHFIKDAVDSVLAQTYQDFELIVVDDGSTDGTQEVLADYRERLKYIYQENQGRSVARNLGAKNAKGKYIAFLDSDDMWTPMKLERQLQVLETNPKIALVHCFTSGIDNKGRHCQELTECHKIHYQRTSQRGYSFEAIALECIIFTSCIAVKRDIFLDLGGFDSSFDYLEDWDFYLRLAFNHKIAVVPEALSLYRYHASQSGNQALTQARIQVAKKQLKLLKSKVNQSRFQLAQRNFAIQLGESYFILGNHSETRRWLWQAIHLDPSLVFRPVWGQHWLLPHLIMSSLPSQITSGMRKLKQTLLKQVGI
ncbi:MAG: glycosyltransferase family 2 protein [Xenococcaceae cyanobacterium]